MALETCFRVGTVAPSTGAAATRACLAHAHKLTLPSCRGPRSTSFSLPTSPSPSPPPPAYPPSLLTALPARRGRGGRLVCEAKNVVAEVLEVTEGTWTKLVLESDKVVLVDFWAPWCGPCRMIDPVIDELAKEYAGKVVCLKLNTDDSPNVATQFGIRSIPTVLVFKDGERKESVIGAVPKSTLTATIEKYLEL
uniref:Thioredoxin M-type, chloroplastic n=1 Tax=Anthurium amnicola TaxID=1678845 RepID=A0A1D1ZJJ2_9ARAE